MRSIGRYAVVREVARGGMGAVFEARGPDGRPVALKLLLAARGADGTRRRRFELEAQALLRVEHPHVVRLLDAGEQDGVPFLVTEWIEGESLQARLDREGPLDPRQAAELVRRVALGVAHCHAQGLLHRDLKPQNVLLRRADGQPLLVDLGLARELARGDGSRPTLSGELLGTPGYWAPEQATGERRAIGPTTDVWGLGALLFAALTGEPPVREASLPEMWAALERDLAPPSRVRPGVPAALDALCAACLRRDPAARPASAAEVAQALAGLGGARPARGVSAARAALLVGGLACVGLAATSLVQLLGGTAADPRPAVGPQDETVASLLSQANARLLANEPVETQALAERALAREPDNQLALQLRGLSHFYRRQLPEALRDLDRALALGPPSPRAHFNRGLAREASGDAPGALADYERALELDPGSALVWFSRGRLRGLTGDLQGELADYDRALDLAPTLSQAWSSRSACRGALGDNLGAEADATRAIELEPRNPVAWANRGMARTNLGTDYRGALADFDRAIALQPGTGGYHLGRGQIRLQLGDKAGGIADLQRFLELSPGDANAPAVRRDLERLLTPE